MARFPVPLGGVGLLFYIALLELWDINVGLKQKENHDLWDKIYLLGGIEHSETLLPLRIKVLNLPWITTSIANGSSNFD